MKKQKIFCGAKGHAIVADIFGEGSPILLAHGGGQTRLAWTRTARALMEAGYSAIAMDLRGHGESAWSPSGSYQLDDFAMDLLAMSDQLNEKPALVGASLGGLAGLIAEGELRSGSFTSLTLVDITPNMEPIGVAHVLDFMRAHLADGFASTDEAADAIANYLPNRQRRKGSESLDRYLRRCDDGRLRWHWDPRFITSVTNDKVGQSENRLADAAKNLKLPIHLIRGGSSNLVSVDAAQEFLRLAPHSTYTDIAGAGHMVVGDRNDAFTEAVVSFFREPQISQRNGDTRDD
ncbi:MAG: alpha/beta fold hydrolase [Bradyrhizobium sp.]